jgi:hypothetical protein
MSLRQIARELGVGASTVRHWLKKLGVQSRSISQAKRGQKPAAHTIEASVRARRKRFLPGRPVVGYKVRSDGYVYVADPEHPNATRCGYVLEHRKVMAERLGRPLRTGEDVHHENKERGDNRPENLEVGSHADHLRHHYAEREIDPVTGRFR